MPALSNGNEKIYFLVKIFENDNYFSLNAQGNYQVDWGDGQAIQNYNSNTQANYEILWSNISASTLTSDGYRQGIITLTPQSGQNLTYVSLNLTHPDNPANSNVQIIDCKIASQSLVSLGGSFKNQKGLEKVEGVGSFPNLTSFSEAFMSAESLKKVVWSDTSSVTSFYRAFFGAVTLLEVSKFNLSSVTSLEQMFFNAYDIEYIEPWSLDSDAPNCTSLKNAFQSASNLMICPITSCSNVTNFTYCFAGNKWGGDFNLNCSSATVVLGMFNGVINLTSVNAIFPNNLTHTAYMFDGCNRLEEVKVFDCSNVTNSEKMFRSTFRIDDLSSFDFRLSTDMSFMFIDSAVRQPPAHLGGGNMLYFARGVNFVKKWGQFHLNITDGRFAFDSNTECNPLPTLPGITNLTTFPSFINMRNIITTPAWDMSNVTANTNFLQGAVNLRESNVTGFTVSHSYSSCQMNRAAIVNVFNNLGTANGTRTLTINVCLLYTSPSPRD